MLLVLLLVIRVVYIPLAVFVPGSPLLCGGRTLDTSVSSEHDNHLLAFFIPRAQPCKKSDTISASCRSSETIRPKFFDPPKFPDATKPPFLASRKL